MAVRVVGGLSDAFAVVSCARTQLTSGEGLDGYSSGVALMVDRDRAQRRRAIQDRIRGIGGVNGRSEERRVGKEIRRRWSQDHSEKNRSTSGAPLTYFCDTSQAVEQNT